MVEKKLNFNQPILSARKHSHKVTSHIVDQREGFPVIHRLPPHRPENSDHVGNPVSVPFQWEQIPGRPKEEILAQSHDYARPFVWEQIPGRPKEDILTQSHDYARPSVWEQIPGQSKEDILAQSYNYARPFVSTEPPCRVEALRETSSDSDASSEPVVGEIHDLGVRQREHERRKVVYQDKSIVLHCKPSFKRGGSGQHENVIRVSCLMPRAFLKSSVCSLSPVPAMSRAHVMTFPGSRMLCESAVPGSSTDSENEVTSREARGYQQQHWPFHVEAPRKKSLRTLRELLDADDAARIVENSESYVKTSGEMKMNGESASDSESDQDSSGEEDIRTAVNEAAENARKRLPREGDAPPPPPPPLPKSPSDSWLSRTLSFTSVRKTRSSVFTSRLSNKYY
ncbi:hypothetical protein SASPL_130075 [Salvia splendens]|uniref:Uncharacterized protein n=1 Tax=Salvia splendens TaxID=180675 RepID=A0A8X8X5E6_SALSN|nr:uncharacterized protein LOC121756467 [Salvia splendens]KAG6407093.1 hypothetical protein SASPL_130075 [Salvia splendens]